MSKFTFDVFISYSHADADWVKTWLLPGLERAGLRACIDSRDFELGAPALDNMTDAAVRSRKTLFVMTPNWKVSEFGQFEALITQTLDPIGRQGRLIPLMLKDCDLPARLQIFTYADFRDPGNWETELARVVKAVREFANDEPQPGRPPALAPNLVHPYPLQANFTGRTEERGELTAWLADGERPVCALVAMGGMGKSALAWYWVKNDVLPNAASSVEGVMWWSFYEGESSFTRFIDEALRYVGGRPIDAERFPTTYDRAQELRRLLQTRHVLFILDGFERQLRAYASLDAAYRPDDDAESTRDARSCVDPNASRLLRDIAAGATRAKLLLTTRLMPGDLEDRAGDPLAGALKRELKELSRANAVAFMRAQGVTKGTDAEIDAACAAYGYHPLSIRLLSGLIARDARMPGDIAAAPRHDVHHDLVHRQHHVLEQSYNALPEKERVLLSRIAAFRSPMGYDALVVFDEFGGGRKFDAALDRLQARGLLQRDFAHNRYDLHPIVRRYCYDRLTDKAGVHTRLRDYFAKIPPRRDKEVMSLEDLTPVIELYHHTLGAGLLDEADRMYSDRLREPLYYRLGEYGLDLQLLLAVPRADDGLPRLSAISTQTWNLIYAGMCCERMGRLRLGASLLGRAIQLNRRRAYKFDLASAQVPYAMLCCDAGELLTADTSMGEAVKVIDRFGDANWQGISHRSWGRVLMLCGNFERAWEEFAIAQAAYEPPELFAHGLSVLFFYKGQLHLWQNNPEQALECARQAQEFSRQGSYVRERIGADWLAGKALVEIALREPARRKEIHPEIERRLGQALTDCRRINLVELEPDILLAWARWHHARGDAQEAQAQAQAARAIADRCEYRLKQAEIHNFMARLALEAGESDKARGHAERARERAWCDGPPYCYRVASEEAEGLLRELGAG